MAHRLERLLQPESIAIIGASDNPDRIGGMPIQHLRHFGYAGRVYPVNSKYDSVFAYRCYPDIESLPETPQLVVLAIAAEDVTPMLERCHARGIGAAMVYAAGFAETGILGQDLQRSLEDFAARSGMVVAGPNCMGFANLNSSAYTAFASVFMHYPVQTVPGRVSIVTQSGNVCSAIFAEVRALDVPVSHFINTGNEAVLEFAEYLEYLAHDVRTDCVLGYIEQLRNGARFIDACLSFARQGKPLILFKAGRTDKGCEAVRSHTAALSGNAAVYEAVFAQLNVIAAEDFAQMADLAYLSGFRARAGGRRIGIVTMSGALGAIMADKLIEAGLEVPSLPEPLQRQLRAGIPSYGMVSNPIDVTGNFVNQAEFAATILSRLASTDALDVVVVSAPGYLLDRLAEALIDVCGRHDRLFVVIDTGKASCRAKLASHGIPVFSDLGRAMRALGPYCRWLARRDVVGQWDKLRETTRACAASAMPLVGLNEHDTKRLLNEFEVPMPAEFPAGNADAAVVAAQRIGYPVVIKIASPDIQHKTEIGGVHLDLHDEASVRNAVREVIAGARMHKPDARIDGVLVQRMTSGIAELIVGVTRDPVFGPLLAVGLGGILTEVYRDVSHRLLPIDVNMARDMLAELRSFPLLDGFRGRPVADVEAACTAIAALAQAFQQIAPAVQAIEINPLQVFEVGRGCVALDALLVPSVAGSIVGQA